MDCKELAETIFDMQKTKNQGRGVSCIRSVCSSLQREDIQGVLAIINNEWDKISNYPDIAEFLKENSLAGKRNYINYYCATKNLLKALNKEDNPWFRERLEEGNFIYCGVGLTQAERQITLLLKVLQCCKKYNCNLNFA